MLRLYHYLLYCRLEFRLKERVSGFMSDENMLSKKS